MNYLYEDVDEDLVEKIPARLLPANSAVALVTKRHVLEIIPELLVTAALTLTVTSLMLLVKPWSFESDQVLLIAMLSLTVLYALSLLPFAIEVFRWNRDILILTQYGLSKIYFDMASLTQKTDALLTITDVGVVEPFIYRLFHFNCGTIEATGVQTSERTPLVPDPYAVKNRIMELKAYRADKEKGGIPWRD